MMAPEDKQEAEKTASDYEQSAREWEALAENQYADAPAKFRLWLRSMAADSRATARALRFFIDEKPTPKSEVQ